MINVNNGKVELDGRGTDFLTDLACVVASVYKSFVEHGLPADVAKKFIENAVTVGFMEGMKNSASDSMESVLSELYETLGEILGKAGKDNGSK
jgi:hypothetical protein